MAKKKSKSSKKKSSSKSSSHRHPSRHAHPRPVMRPTIDIESQMSVYPSAPMPRQRPFWHYVMASVLVVGVVVGALYGFGVIGAEDEPSPPPTTDAPADAPTDAPGTGTEAPPDAPGTGTEAPSTEAPTKPPGKTPSGTKKPKKKGKVTGIAIGSVAAVVIIAGALYYFQKKQHRQKRIMPHYSSGGSFSSLGPDIERYGHEVEDIADYEFDNVAPKLRKQKSEMTQLAEQMEHMHIR